MQKHGIELLPIKGITTNAIEMANLDTAQTKPILVYDGDCNFCRYCVLRWSHITKDRIEYAAYQEVSAKYPEIPISNFQSSVQLILESGQVYSGAEAVLQALNNRVLLWCYKKVPGFSLISETTYQFVANHRQHFSRLTRRLWKKHIQ